ncbi:MAG: GC-type dockerin domain-anchored protein [Phycisphaerales bacterium JB052]
MNIIATLTMTLLAGTSLAGPDILVSQITGAQSYGAINDYQSFSFGDITCNIGDAPFTYVDSTNQHPVFTSSIYRLRDGRFEQVGLGFVGHTFFPLQSNACDLGCNPASPGMLGDGCSDTMGAGLAGSQAGLGPRSEVSAYSGDFPYPFTTINQSGNPVYKRVKAIVGDISDISAMYFVETQYISNEEQTDAARNNNTSYRRLSFTPGSNTPQLSGDTFAGQAAIYAWQSIEPSVMITPVQIPGDGLVHVASNATDLGDGTWRYDYAVHNLNSERGISSFSIPIGLNRFVSDQSFHDITYLDDVDSDIDGTDWMLDNMGGYAGWTTGQHFDDNPLANAIRWGTTYSFSMVSPYAPTTKAAELGMFDDDGLDAVVAQIVAPMSGPCRIDMNGDLVVNYFDISTFINAFGLEDLNTDFTGDGELNFFDISQFLNEYVAGCP